MRPRISVKCTIESTSYFTVTSRVCPFEDDRCARTASGANDRSPSRNGVEAAQDAHANSKSVETDSARVEAAAVVAHLDAHAVPADEGHRVSPDRILFGSSSVFDAIAEGFGESLGESVAHIERGVHGLARSLAVAHNDSLPDTRR